MTISDAQFAQWLSRDNARRVCLVQLDYMVESSGEPIPATWYASDQGYIDGASSIAYPDCINAIPTFTRALSGDRFGVYQATLGTVEVDNADGGNDAMLDFAMDGSQIRFYLGDASWLFSDFRLIFVATGALVGAPKIDRLSITIQDTGARLNQSIGGDILVGGTGPSADQARPLNFGFLHQIQMLVVDQPTLLYCHSDNGNGIFAVTVRDRGVPVSFTDNGDGTITLPATPDGTVTADVMAVTEGSAPGDYSQRKVSDAFYELVGNRVGLVADGLYVGAGPTFSVGDDDDYLVGISITNQQNVVDFLSQIVDSGNCFWAVTRGGAFTFGRLRPNDIASLGINPVSIVEDDIDIGSTQLVHLAPTYYQFQGYMSKNWSVQSDLATSLTPDERATLQSNGLYAVQDPSVGDTYADNPQLYDLSMVVSPSIDTLLSAGFDGEDELSTIDQWMNTRRFMLLPWIETIQIAVGIEFYALELGDVVELTLPRYGCGGGALFQVISINIRMTDAKIDLILIRRRISTPYPDGWVYTTTEPALLIRSAAVPTTPPPVVPPPVVSLSPSGAPWYPTNIPAIPLLGPGSVGGWFTPFRVSSSGPTIYYSDNFSDIEANNNLWLHNPQVGAHYADSMPGDDPTFNEPFLEAFQLLSDLLVGPSNREAGPALSTLAHTIGTTYSVETRFIVDAGTIDNVELDMGTQYGPDYALKVPIEITLTSVDGSSWSLAFSLETAAFSTVDVTSLISRTTYYILHADVFPNRAYLYFDGALLATSVLQNPTGVAARAAINVVQDSATTLLQMDYAKIISTVGASPAFTMDTFIDADSTALTSHTSDTGHTWAFSPHMDFGGSVGSTNLEIVGDVLQAATWNVGSLNAVVSNFDAGSANHFVEARIVGTAVENVNIGFAFRYTDSSGSGYFLNINGGTAGNHYTVSVRGATGYGDTGETTMAASSVACTKEDFIIRIEIRGSTITALIGDASLITLTSTYVTAGSHVGFWLSLASGTGASADATLYYFASGAL